MAAERSQGLGALTFVNPHRVEGAFHTRSIPAVGVPGSIELTGLSAVADVQVPGAGRMFGLLDFLEFTHSTSLLITVGDETVVEWYADGLRPTDLFLGASMTKSVLACLVGQAVAAGSLSLETRVVDQVEELSESGYADCTVRDLLSMTTGVDWVEDHRDLESRASQLLAAFSIRDQRDGGGDSRKLLADVPVGVAPGQRFAYNTADSQVLDWVRERATGHSYADAVADLWVALGCETSGAVVCDGPGDGAVALAGGGLCASARDWARLGRLQLTGLAGRDRLLGQDWIDNSSRPTYPFTAPGTLPSTITTHAGFGWHWWPLDDEGRRLTADGSRGQFTYLDRDLDVVVVKTSQWPYDDLTDRQCRDLSYLALPRIATTAHQKG